jgi:streptogramin lyase
VEVALPMGAAGFVGSPTSLSVDRAGDVWIGGQGNELIHGRVDERGQPQVSRVGLSGHWSTDPIGRVAVDGGGDVWISSFGQLGRIRGGVAEVIRAPGTTETLGRALYVDSRGWLWVGLRGDGVLVSKNPAADVPVFERLTIASGLSGNTVRALTEDRRGRIYFSARAPWIARSVTGEWWRLTIEDGLPGARS